MTKMFPVGAGMDHFIYWHESLYFLTQVILFIDNSCQECMTTPPKFSDVGRASKSLGRILLPLTTVNTGSLGRHPDMLGDF